MKDSTNMYVCDPVRSDPRVLEYIEGGFDKKNLYQNERNFSRLSIDDITKLIAGVDTITPINLHDFFLSICNEYTATQTDVLIENISESIEQCFVSNIQAYISFIESRFSWFRVISMRGLYGKSSESKKQMTHKISDVDRKIQFFCNQLRIIATQKREIPERPKKSRVSLIFNEIKGHIVRFLANQENTTTKLLR